MNKSTEAISIKVILSILRKRAVPILLCTVILALTALLVYGLIIPRQYTATVSIIVENRSYHDDTEETGGNQKTSSDITASRMLADTYIAIFKTTAFLESVCIQVNETSDVIQSGNHDELQSIKIIDMLEMRAVNSTEVLQINATSSSPQLSVDICYAIVDVAEIVLSKTMNTFAVNSVEGDNIIVPELPSGPNVFGKIQIWALVGAFGSALAYVLIYIFKEHMKDTSLPEREYNERPYASPSAQEPRTAAPDAEFRQGTDRPSVPFGSESAVLKARRHPKPGRQTPTQRP